MPTPDANCHSRLSAYVVRRKAVTFVAVGSLLLLFAAAGMWARSIWWRGDLIAAVGTRALVIIRSESGLIFVNVSGAPFGSPKTMMPWPAGAAEQPGLRHDSWPRSTGWSAWDGLLGRRWWHRLGFRHTLGSTTSGQRVHHFVVPYYVVFVCGGVVPALLLVRILRARRRSATGHCPRCGYDLRATPGRCPECGAEAALRPAA